MDLMFDKKNGNVAFRESDHTYFDVRDPKKTYISVTTCISDYKEKFDSDFWSKYKALEAIVGIETFKSSNAKKKLLSTKIWNEIVCKEFGMNTDGLVIEKALEIAEGYKKTAEEACAYGTAYHLQQELKFYVQPKIDLSLFDKRFCGEYECKKDYYELDLTHGAYPEYLIYWEEEDLRISGQIDLLIKDKNDIYLIDYKTNSKGIETQSYYDHKTHSYKMMKYPVQGLMDCSKMHYTLQLSFYARLLQKINPEFNIKLLLLKHCDREGVETDIELEYLPEEVDKIIKDIKKKNYIERERNRRL